MVANALEHNNRGAFPKDTSGLSFPEIPWHCERHLALEFFYLGFKVQISFSSAMFNFFFSPVEWGW